MAVRSLGQLTLDLVAKTGGFTGPLDKASRQLKKSAKGITTDLTNIAKGVGTFSAAASAAVVSVAYLVDRVSRSAVELQKFASVADTSVTELQAWGTVTESMGVNTEKFSDILKDLNDRLGEFATTGSGELKDFFELAEEIGVTIDDFEGLSGAQSLQLVLDTIDRLGLSSQQATFILESLADEASALSGLSSEAAKRAGELATQLETMGIAQDAVDSQLFQEYAQSAGEAKTIVSALATTFASELVPYITEALNETIEYGGGIEDLDEAFREWIESAIIGLGNIANGFHQFQKVSADTDVAIAQIRKAFAGFIQDALEGVADLVRAVEKAEPVLDALDRVFGGAGVDISATAEAIDQMGNNLVELANTNLDDALGRQARTAAVDYVESAKEIIEAARQRREEIAAAGESESEREKITRTLIDTTDSASKADKEAAREAEKLAAAQQSLIDNLFPLEAAQRKYREDTDLLAASFLSGKIGADKYFDSLERLRTGLSQDMTGGFMEQLATGGLREDLEKTNDFAKDLGLTFTSAFEDAIIEGNSFRDVLAGIGEDIQRLLIRKSITEPAVDAIGGFDWAGLVGGMIGGASGGISGPGAYSTTSGGFLGSVQFADGGYTGPGGKYDPAGIVHAGEFVIPKDVVSQPGMLPFLEAIKDGKGYADGGFVGSMPNIPAGGVGGGTTVEIIDQRSGGARPEVTETQGRDGMRRVRVMIRDEVKSMFNDGSMDRTMARNFGPKRRPL